MFVTLDIENDLDGNVLDIGTYWQENGEENYKVVGSWESWWAWYYRIALNDPEKRVVYAHNGGGWDWLSLAQFLIESDEKENRMLTAVCAGSNMVVLNVRVKGKFTIHFCDSLQLLRSSLDKLAGYFFGTKKVDTKGKLPHQLKIDDPETYYEYLKNDCKLLHDVLEEALRLLKDNVVDLDSFGYTIGSTAMKVFRELKNDDTEIKIPWDDKQKAFLRSAYAGGRIECFKPGYYPKVKVYDINSLYPSVMLSQSVPVSDRLFFTDCYGDGLGVYKCSYNQRRRDLPPVLVVDGLGSYANKGVFFSVELDLLREVDPDAEIIVEEGYQFLDTEKLFTDYVEKLFALRMRDKQGPLGLLCKFLLNSLYGKFGQKSLREQLVMVESVDDLYSLITSDAGIECTPLSECIYAVQKEVHCEHEHVGIAGVITSSARASLYRGMLACGFDNLIYVDTDSVHTSGAFPSNLVGDSLGLWKLEFEGEGVYAGKKLYALRDKKGKEKIRCKGVSVGGSNGASLSFDDLCRVAGGAEIECNFLRPATPKEVFKGKQSCKFLNRKRTIRKTAICQT